MISEQEQFAELCAKRKDIPFFLSYDWITAVAGPEEWGVVFSGPPEDPKGFFLYSLRKKFGFRRILLPPLTPYSGPWIFYPKGQKRAEKYGYEKKVLEELIHELPDHDELVLHFHPQVSNWLPFYWKGFEERTRYTYRIDTSYDLDALYKGLKGNIRGAIRKGQENHELRSSENVEPLYELKLEDLQKRGGQLHYDRDLLKRIDSCLSGKDRRKILYAVDQKGILRAGIYLVMGEVSCYYLIGAMDPADRKSGAMPFLIWNGIQEAARKEKIFDLEGSMVESIEQFFRAFGAEQTPFHEVMHTPSFLLRGRRALRRILENK